VNNGLNAFFKAESIAVVGASSKEGKTGHTILKNLINSGFQGMIYPINPNSDNILWLKAYPNLKTVGRNVDLVVFTIPAHGLPEAMKEAGEMGVKAAVIITGGLGEIGNHELEQEVLNIARSYQIRVIGPNCQGISYTHNNLCASWPLTTVKGSIAIISQSGTIGAALSGWAQNEQIGISGCVSLGNKADVDECDLLEYFADDPNTSVIALNIEGVSNGARFLEVCHRVSVNKPIVVLKPGRSQKGKEAAASHTKSVAGNAEVFEAVCRRAHLIQARNTTEFFDFTKALALSQSINSTEISIITSSGGSGILAVDSAEDEGLEVIDLFPEILEELKEKLPSHCVIRNPLDLTGDSDAERFYISTEVIGKQAPGAFLLIYGDPILGAAEVTDRIAKSRKITPVCCYIGGGDVEREEVVRLQQLGYPTFPVPERAIAAIRVLYQYNRYVNETRRIQSV